MPCLAFVCYALPAQSNTLRYPLVNPQQAFFMAMEEVHCERLSRVQVLVLGDHVVARAL